MDMAGTLQLAAINNNNNNNNEKVETEVVEQITPIRLETSC